MIFVISTQQNTVIYLQATLNQIVSIHLETTVAKIVLINDSIRFGQLDGGTWPFIQ